VHSNPATPKARSIKTSARCRCAPPEPCRPLLGNSGRLSQHPVACIDNDHASVMGGAHERVAPVRSPFAQSQASQVRAGSPRVISQLTSHVQIMGLSTRLTRERRKRSYLPPMLPPSPLPRRPTLNPVVLPTSFLCRRPPFELDIRPELRATHDSHGVPTCRIARAIALAAARVPAPPPWSTYANGRAHPVPLPPLIVPDRPHSHICLTQPWMYARTPTSHPFGLACVMCIHFVVDVPPAAN
jgi:hypothetical protein